MPQPNYLMEDQDGQQLLDLRDELGGTIHGEEQLELFDEEMD